MLQAHSPESPGQEPQIETLSAEYEHLRSLSYVHCDLRFTHHLRKISRDIYDNLWQHLGMYMYNGSDLILMSVVYIPIDSIVTQCYGLYLENG